MFVRIVVFGTIVCLLSVLVEAQAPRFAFQARVRITGSRAYEIPGVLKVDSGRVSGNSSVTTDEMTMRVVVPQTGQQLVMLKPGKRFVGRVFDVRDRVVTFLGDGQQDTVAIPLDSIGTLELSVPGRHLLRGILLGAGAFFGVSVLVAAGCGLYCTNAVLLTPAIAGGIATGVIAGGRREAWKMVPRAWLSSQFSETFDAPSLPSAVGLR